MRARAPSRRSRVSVCDARGFDIRHRAGRAPGARRSKRPSGDAPRSTVRDPARGDSRRAFTFFRFSVSAGNEIRVYRRFEAPSRRASAAPRRAIAGKRNETSAIDARARRSDRTRDAVGRAVGAVRVRVSASKRAIDRVDRLECAARRRDERATRDARSARRARRGKAATRDDRGRARATRFGDDARRRASA